MVRSVFVSPGVFYCYQERMCPRAGITALAEFPASGVTKVYGLVPWVFFLVVNHPDHSKYPMAHYCGWQRFHLSLPHLLQHGSTLCSEQLRVPRPDRANTRAKHLGSASCLAALPSHHMLIFASSSVTFQLLIHHYHVADPLRGLPLGLRPALLHRRGGRLRSHDGPGRPAERGLEGAGRQGRAIPA